MIQGCKKIKISMNSLFNVDKFVWTDSKRDTDKVYQTKSKLKKKKLES